MYLYTSDLHLYHDNIIKLCNRPFKNVDEMHETIKNNWNKKVKPDDTVIVGGDVGYPKSSKDFKLITEFIKELNGKKILVSGNHDNKLVTNKAFRNCFEFITKYLEIEDNGIIILEILYIFMDMYTIMKNI